MQERALTFLSGIFITAALVQGGLGCAKSPSSGKEGPRQQIRQAYSETEWQDTAPIQALLKKAYEENDALHTIQYSSPQKPLALYVEKATNAPLAVSFAITSKEAIIAVDQKAIREFLARQEVKDTLALTIIFADKHDLIPPLDVPVFAILIDQSLNNIDVATASNILSATVAVLIEESVRSGSENAMRILLGNGKEEEMGEFPPLIRVIASRPRASQSSW